MQVYKACVTCTYIGWRPFIQPYHCGFHPSWASLFVLTGTFVQKKCAEMCTCSAFVCICTYVFSRLVNHSALPICICILTISGHTHFLHIFSGLSPNLLSTCTPGCSLQDAGDHWKTLLGPIEISQLEFKRTSFVPIFKPVIFSFQTNGFVLE